MNAKDIIISNFTIDNPQKFKLLLLLFFVTLKTNLPSHYINHIEIRQILKKIPLQEH
jgi:hypothetical protein